MGVLATPDPEQYLDSARDDATVEQTAGDGTAKVYHVGNIYRQLAYDKWGIEADHGDYNAEWLGIELAERLAEEAFRADTDFEGEVTLVARQHMPDFDSDISNEERKDQTYYEVAVVPA